MIWYCWFESPSMLLYNFIHQIIIFIAVALNVCIALGWDELRINKWQEMVEDLLYLLGEWEVIGVQEG